jgi:glycosyltransferase involved in cell wall biosynthesis
MIRVVFYTDTRAYGGAEAYLARLASGLDSSRYSVRVALLGAQGPVRLVEALERRGIPVDALEVATGAGTLAKIRRLRDYLESVEAEVLHINRVGGTRCAHAIWAGRWAGVRRVVLTEHYVFPLPLIRDSSGHGRLRTIGHALRRAVYVARRRASVVGTDSIITVSEDSRRLFVGQYRYPKRKTIVVYNGVDVSDAIEPAEERPSRNDGPPRPVLGYLGRLDHKKGVQYLIAAMPRIRERFPRACAWVMGDGPAREELEATVHQLGLGGSVLFLGDLADPRERLDQIDVLVHPTLEDTLSFAVLEAMAAGKPVVASSIGGVPELVVAGSTGFLFPPASPEALADAVGRLFADPETPVRMGRAARNRVRATFSAGEMVRHTSMLY